MDGQGLSRRGCPLTLNIGSEVSTLLYNLAKIENAELDQADQVEEHVCSKFDVVQELQRLCGVAAKTSNGLTYPAKNLSYPASMPSADTAKFGDP